MNHEIQRPGDTASAENFRSPTGLDRVNVIAKGISAVDTVQGLHPGCVVIIKNDTTGTTIRGDIHPKRGEKRIRIRHSPDA
ncbi:MAG: hypothetical protein AAB907_04055 [Patescibacteria group bacterium]